MACLAAHSQSRQDIGIGVGRASELVIVILRRRPKCDPPPMPWASDQRHARGQAWKRRKEEAEEERHEQVTQEAYDRGYTARISLEEIEREAYSAGYRAAEEWIYARWQGSEWDVETPTDWRWPSQWQGEDEDTAWRSSASPSGWRRRESASPSGWRRRESASPSGWRRSEWRARDRQ